MTLGEMLERSAEKNPEKIAIVYKEQRVKYKELNADANRLGNVLNKLGVGRNDKVGVLMANCPEFVMGVFAALKAGAVFVALNGLLSGRELTYVINNSDTKVIITAPPYDSLLAMLRPQLPQVEHILTLDNDPEDEGLEPFYALMASANPANLKPPVKLTEGAAIYYTSGTTGLPKGAMLSHVNILSSTVAIGKAVNASRKDVPLCCLPMFHTLAMTACIMVPIFAGMTNILLENFLPQPVLKAFSDWKVTIFVGVPTMFAVLANMPKLERYDVSNFRLGYVGGAPLTTNIVEKFESKFPAELYEGYGLSECAPLVSVNPLGNRKIGSIGKAADRVEWKIVDDHDHEVPRNAVGEIVCKGPNVMMEYYKDPESTEKAMRNGWFHTGDLAYMDEDGFVFIADRKKDMLIVGGENVYPKEVENVLVQHPAIDDAGVIGIEDPIRGEVPKAYVVPKLGATIDEQDVLAFCRKHLAQYKVPRSIEAIDEIPKNVTGKILKRILRRMAAGLPEEDEEEDMDEQTPEPEVEEAHEVFQPEPQTLPAGGMSLEDQIRLLEGGGGGTTPPPPGIHAGMSLEDQIRLLEGGAPTPPPGLHAGMSMEEQLRLLAGNAEDDEDEAAPPKPPVKPVAPKKPIAEQTGEAAGFEEHLRNLVMDIPGGIAGSIIGYDGIGITSFSTDPDFPTTLADAELAGIMGSLRKGAESLSAGDVQEVYFLTERYGIVTRSIQAQYIVVLVTDAHDLNWGLTRVQLNKIVPLIEQELF